VHLGQGGHCGVAFGFGVVVELHVVDLVPLVGTHDQYVVPAGDIDEQAGFGHDEVEPVVLVGDVLQGLDAVHKLGDFELGFGQWNPRHAQVDSVELALCERGLRYREMRQRERVEGAWVDPNSATGARH
jgi:hypothetical protein